LHRSSFISFSRTTALGVQSLSSPWATLASSRQPKDDHLTVPNNSAQSRIVEINSPAELATFLHQDDALCVIKFHAAWCKSCQRFGLKYQGLAHKYKSSSNVRFASIEFGANMVMCRKLGIKRLPTIHMYQKDKGKIDAFCCGPKKFPMLLERLKRHMETLELESRFSEFTDTLEEGSQLLASVAPESTAATTTQESPTEMAGILQETMMEQDVNDSLETKISIQKTSRGRRQAMQNNQKSWWKRILP